MMMTVVRTIMMMVGGDNHDNGDHNDDNDAFSFPVIIRWRLLCLVLL